MHLTPFHLAIPVRDLGAAQQFYGNLLGCSQGRRAESWIDFNFFGHQLVCHLDAQLQQIVQVINQVDGHGVPVPHFGVVLEMDVWKSLAQKLESRDVKFIIEPHIRFKGQSGEQATMFFLDPDGHALEFKAFKDIEEELFKV